MIEIHDYVEFTSDSKNIKGIIKDIMYDCRKNVLVVVEDKYNNLYKVNILDVRPTI